jgi:hypothetical protein
LKQAATAQWQRSSPIPANSIEAYLFKAPKAVAQWQQISPIAANSIAGYIAANSIAAHRFEATSGTAVAANQPIQLQLIDLKQAAVAQRQ